MPDKPISLSEMMKAKSEGAEFEFDPDVLTIERFDDLIAALSSMAANEAERIRADLARNQTNLEIIGALQSLIKKSGEGPKAQPVDLSPIRDLLEEIRSERSREPTDYDFKIIRSGGDGYQPAQRIEARAVKPTTH